MSFYDAELQQIAHGLPRNKWISSQLCPACQGGNTGERTLSIYHDATGIAAKCHRNSCGQSFKSGYFDSNPEPTILQTPNPYAGSLLPLDDARAKGLGDRFAMAPGEIQKYIRDAGQGWLALPVYSPRGVVRGYGIRWPWGEAPPYGQKKFKLFMHNSDEVNQSWYGDIAPASVWLVEDQMSAMRLAAYGERAVALIGTELTQSKVYELQRNFVTRVNIALDADATTTAFKLAQQWGPAFKECRVTILTADIKDMKLTDIKDML